MGTYPSCPGEGWRPTGPAQPHFRLGELQMKRRDAITKLAAATAALALPAWAQSGRIILGQSAAFSGPAAQLGIQMNQGAKIYFDHLNANGGINGQHVEIKTLDDGYEPERCKANTEKFIK